MAPGETVARLYFDCDRAARVKNTFSGSCVAIVCDGNNSDICVALADAMILAEGLRSDSPTAQMAREKGIPTICGIEVDKIDFPNREIHVKGYILREGQVVRINGDEGTVYEFDTLAA